MILRQQEPSDTIIQYGDDIHDDILPCQCDGNIKSQILGGGALTTASY